MRVTIYKTKGIDGETFATPDIALEYTIDELTVSSKALRQLFKVVKKEELNAIFSGLKGNELSLFVITKLMEILQDENDEILYFLRRVMIENGYYVTGDQLNTVAFEEQLQLLCLMFRISWESVVENFNSIFKKNKQLPEAIESK